MNSKWIAIIVFFLTLPIYAVEKTKTIELNTLNKNIATIKQDLTQSTAQRSVLQKSLAQTEMTESHLDQALQSTQQIMTTQQAKLKQLQEESIPLQEAKNQNHLLLEQQLRAAYSFNQQPYLKLLLAPDDITQTHRIMMYFHYITQAQIETMKKLQASLTACEENQQAIQAHYTKLSSLQQIQIQNQESLKKTQSQRQELIQSINQQIATKQQKLSALMHDKDRLEKTIARLSQESETSTAVFSNKPLTQLRGKMPWPLAGHIRHQFGTQVYQSELKWDGVLINAQVGQAVRAVAPGRVIFAKWMAGYGLLLIINHGNGYMTLYGRNQTLDRKVGDRVSAGDEIATAGKSGGFQAPGLYFSIRHNAQALNPSHWCH